MWCDSCSIAPSGPTLSPHQHFLLLLLLLLLVLATIPSDRSTMVGANALEEIAHAFIKALETLDLNEMIQLRSPDCVQRIYPKSMGYPEMDNARSAEYRSLHLISTSASKFMGADISAFAKAIVLLTKPSSPISMSSRLQSIV